MPHADPAAAPLRELRTGMARLRRGAEAQVREALPRWSLLPRRVPTRPPSVDAARRVPPAPWPNHSGGGSLLAERSGLITRAIHRAVLRPSTDAAWLRELVAEMIDRAARFGPGFLFSVALGLHHAEGDVAAHMYASGAVSAAAALQLRWPRWHVEDAAASALLADAGMLLTRPSPRPSRAPMSDLELNATRRHPFYSAALAMRFTSLPESAFLSILQHHERPNGSGYPTSSRDNAIHDYALLIAAADTFVAAASERKHRPRNTLHDAITAVAVEAAHRRLAPWAARAVLLSCGLHPPGELVQLTTGAVAEVKGYRTGAHFDQPIVRVLRAAAGPNSPADTDIDLSSASHTHVRVERVLRVPRDRLLGVLASASPNNVH